MTDTFRMKCSTCGVLLNVPVNAAKIRCPRCGTEYARNTGQQPAPKRSSADTGSGIREIPFMGRGTIYYAAVPEGWSADAVLEENVTSGFAKICPVLIMRGSNSSLMFFSRAMFRTSFPRNAYGDMMRNMSRNAMPASARPNARGDYELDPMSMSRLRKFDLGAEYAKVRFLEIFPSAQDIRIAEVGDRGTLDERSGGFASEVEQAYQCPISTIDAGRYSFTFTMNGAPTGAVLEFIHIGLDRASQQQGPAMFGVNLTDYNTPDWVRAYDAVSVCSPEDLEEEIRLLNTVVTTINYGPLLKVLEQEEQQAIDRAIMQGNMERQQIIDNASRQLTQTLNETNDIISQGYAERSAMMDRTAERYSESIRGVNSYERTDGGTVEADVRWDNVYQHNDTFIGSEGMIDPLPQGWTKLERKE